MNQNIENHSSETLIQSKENDSDFLPNRLLSVIKEQLKTRKITIQELSERMKISQSQVSRILSGASRLDTHILHELTMVIGVPVSTLYKEAEGGNKKLRIDEKLEEYICSDLKVYAIFTALNFPCTIDKLVSDLGINEELVSNVIKKLEHDHIVFRPIHNVFQLTDIAKDISFGRSKSFYDLKAKLYSFQSLNSYKNLNRGTEYWSDKDDQIKAVRLSKGQLKTIANQIESLCTQLYSMDQMNQITKVTPLGMETSDSDLHMVFLALKPLNSELLRNMIEEENKTIGN